MQKQFVIFFCRCPHINMANYHINTTFAANMSNLIIEINMEELRKDSLKLGIWNIAAPFGFVVIGLIIIISFRYIQPDEGFKSFAGLGALFEIPLFTFFYLYWYKFLGGMNRCYRDNDKLKYAVILGWIAISLKLFQTVVGLILVEFPVFFQSSFSISMQFTPNGMIPQGTFMHISAILYTTYSTLFLFMFLLIMLSAELKSAVRILSLIIIIMFGILITFPHIFPAAPWILMELALAVTMLLFFNKIHKGYQFPAQL